MEAWGLHTSSRAVQGCVAFAIVFFPVYNFEQKPLFQYKTNKNIWKTVIGFQQF